jgi:hypothetical protein
MKNVLIAIITFVSIVTSAMSNPRTGETKVVSKNFKEAIEIYTLFVKILSTDYIKSQNNLIDNDKNFPEILKMVHYVLDENRRNVDLNSIESYVISKGSGKFLNDYKGLFVFWFDLKHALTACPSEITYFFDKNGRITYFEAKDVLKKNDKQIFDRTLLEKFSITKQKFKSRYNREL